MSRAAKGNVGRFINEVCQLFDITVLCDIEDISDEGEEFRVKTVVCLGWNSEPDAGIRYGTVTPWFANEDELEAFCERNIEAFRKHADAMDKDYTVAVVDATDWK
jgi:hypothetical protein